MFKEQNDQYNKSSIHKNNFYLSIALINGHQDVLATMGRIRIHQDNKDYIPLIERLVHVDQMPSNIRFFLLPNKNPKSVIFAHMSTSILKSSIQPITSNSKDIMDCGATLEVPTKRSINLKKYFQASSYPRHLNQTLSYFFMKKNTIIVY